MSTYGEIVEPVSRTAWEDWDDILSEENNNKLKWSNNSAVPDKINMLLILEGKFLHNCITTQLKTKFEVLDFVKEIGLTLYKMDQSNKYICIIKEYNLLHSSEIVELLKPHIMLSSNVITIQTKPLTEYQSFELINQDCIIRTVSTTKPFFEVHFPRLEQPNIISGVSAGVISLREHLGLVGGTVVCYVEYPDDYQVEELQALLRKLCIIPDTCSKPTSVINSNLYI